MDVKDCRKFCFSVLTVPRIIIVVWIIFFQNEETRTYLHCINSAFEIISKLSLRLPAKCFCHSTNYIFFFILRKFSKCVANNLSINC